MKKVSKKILDEKAARGARVSVQSKKTTPKPKASNDSLLMELVATQNKQFDDLIAATHSMRDQVAMTRVEPASWEFSVERDSKTKLITKVTASPVGRIN